MIRVTLFDEYIATYREAFYQKLIETGKIKGLNINIASGKPSNKQLKRNDRVSPSWNTNIRQVELNIFGKRVVIRQIGSQIRDSDIVILSQARRNLDLYRLLLFRPKNLVIALFGHGKDFVKDDADVFAKLLLWITKKADYFFSYTKTGSNYLVSNGFPANKITVFNNSIDIEQLSLKLSLVDSEQVIETNNQFDLKGKTALFLGGLDESKRLKFLLDAAEYIHSQDHDFRLLIAGDGEERNLVTRFSDQKTWCHYVGRADENLKSRLFSSANIILNPGRVGLLAVESLATGIPILTTRWKYHAPEFEYLEDGKTCLVSENTITDFSNNCLTYLNSPTKQGDFAKACLEEAEKYSVENMANQFVDGLLTLASSHFHPVK